MSQLHEDALEIPAFLKRAKGEKPGHDDFYRERPLSKAAKPELSADEVERARITAEAEEVRLAKSRGRVATMKARFAAKDAAKAGKVFDLKTGLYYDPKVGLPKLSDVLGAKAKEQDVTNIEIQPRSYAKASDAKRAAMAMLGPDADFEVGKEGPRFIFKPVTKKPPSAKNAKPAKVASGKTGIARQFDGEAKDRLERDVAKELLRQIEAKGGKPKKPGKKAPAKPARKGKAPAAASAPADGAKPAGGAPKGKRAEVEASARAGTVPAAPDFSAETHKPHRARLAEIVAMVDAKDVASLKAATFKSYSSSQKAIQRYRDLAVLALEAAKG